MFTGLLRPLRRGSYAKNYAVRPRYDGRMAARKPPAPPAPRMTFDHWAAEFIAALNEPKLRPDIGWKFGRVIAVQEYREGLDPRKAAADWAKRSADAR